jgi:kynureninase
MVLITPSDSDSSIITTSHIISTIDEHASSTALILLPGIQYYTGQYFDIKAITSHAHSHGIIIGWDLAHAVGNVDVQLHDWDVDFAVWCNYKYVNSGPGAIAGLFVHSNHGTVSPSLVNNGHEAFRPRFCGWWGSDKATRFEMSCGGFVLSFQHFITLIGDLCPSAFAMCLY